MDIIRSEAGQALREELAKSPDKIISTISTQESLPAPMADDPNAIGMPNPAESGAVVSGEGLVSGQGNGTATTETSELQYQGIALISALVKLIPDWLLNNRPVFDALLRVWHSPARQARLQNEQNLNLNQVRLVMSLCY